MNKLIFALPALALLAACGQKSGNDGNASGSASSGPQVTGAGSTFVYPVLSAWASDYQKQAGTAINYQSIGTCWPSGQPFASATGWLPVASAFAPAATTASALPTSQIL